MRRLVRWQNDERLPVDELRADESCGLAEERVPETARAVEVVDRYVNRRVRGKRVHRRTLPTPGVVTHEVRDPVRIWRERRPDRRDRLKRQVDCASMRRG